jgi:hypothetical protein
MTKRRPLPDAEYLRSLFIYEPETGILRWRVDRAAKKAGDVAGAHRPSGYIQVGIDFKLYRAHLIIWKMETGEEPPHFLDHENTIKNDNRWINLREANKSQNQANIGLTASNTTGHKGVFWYRAYQKWAVQVWKDGVAHFGGYHEKLEDAVSVAAALRVKLYGEFAREK